MNEFEKARDILQGIRDAEAGGVIRKCDWADPDEVALYKERVRLEVRLAAIDQVKRVCPNCGEVKEDPRQWVVKEDGSEVLCRSCFQVQSGRPPGEIFSSKSVRYTLDPEQFSLARTRTRMSQRTFAERAGWSQPYQCALESGKYDTISEETAETILQVLREFYDAQSHGEG